MLEDLQPLSDKRSCRVRTLTTELNEKDAQILLDAVADDIKWSVNGLSAALASRGISLSKDAIIKHRRQRCSC